jgi:acyl-CoA synthetase (AMP-forming)/AMP-acid ligase II
VLLGRSGRMVKIGGRRLDPAEVEQALRQMPAVLDAFVAPHRNRADTLVAAVASPHSADELRAWLLVRIAGWKIPRKFVLLAEFPLTARGKTDTRRLRALMQGS